MSETKAVVLCPLDYIPPGNYVRLLFPLPLKSDADDKTVFADLHYALHKTFVQDPWLAGKVFLQNPETPGWKPGQLEIRYGPYTAQDPWPYQLKYQRLETDWTYDEWQESGFPSGIFSEDLLLGAPTVGDVAHDGADIFLCQANFLPGGLLLGMTTFHGAIDASGMLNVQKSWAENFRELHERDCGGQIAPSRFSFVDQDRTVADRIWKRETEGTRRPVDAKDPWIRGLIALDAMSSHADHDQISNTAPTASLPEANESSRALEVRRNMINRVMFLSSEDLSALHQECLKEPSPKGSSPVSVSDAINALFWRSVLRARFKAAQARGFELDSVSVFESPVDVREAFGPDFPGNYLGNCFLLNTARMPLAELIDPSVPLGRIAQALRVGASRLTNKMVHDAYGLLRETPDLSKVQGRFVDRPDSADILLSNIIFFPMTEIDFGSKYFLNGGVPPTLRVLHGSYAPRVRLGHVLPKSAKHGGCELSVNLFADEYPHLDVDEEFNRYLTTIEPERLVK